MKPRLIAVFGPLEGTTFDFSEEEVTIGREVSNLIAVTDHSVSRRHCLIRREAGTFKVIDLEVFNGAFVNGLPVGEQALSDGDHIAPRHARFLFLL